MIARLDELRGEWAEIYGELVAAQLEPDRRYTLLRLGAAEFAYTTFEHYLRALGQGWAAGLVPEPLPTAEGRRLAQVAPRLRGVDTDLASIDPAEIEVFGTPVR